MSSPSGAGILAIVFNYDGYVYAFDESIQGIINLKKLQQKVEIRIVLHKISIKKLIPLCIFISRNLLFIDHVVIMALEMTGFTKANIDKL